MSTKTEPRPEGITITATAQEVIALRAFAEMARQKVQNLWASEDYDPKYEDILHLLSVALYGEPCAECGAPVGLCACGTFEPPTVGNEVL